MEYSKEFGLAQKRIWQSLRENRKEIKSIEEFLSFLESKEHYIKYSSTKWKEAMWQVALKSKDWQDFKNNFIEWGYRQRPNPENPSMQANTLS